MKPIAQAKDFWDKNRKVLTVVIGTVLAVLFIGSILLAVFMGGEFTKEPEAPVTAKGKISFASSDYKTEYDEGDEFYFNKAGTEVMVIAKIPDEEEIFRDQLYDNEYGFQVNGEGEILMEASEITITSEVTAVSVVWVKHPTIKTDIPVTLIGADATGD